MPAPRHLVPAVLVAAIVVAAYTTRGGSEPSSRPQVEAPAGRRVARPEPPVVSAEGYVAAVRQIEKGRQRTVEAVGEALRHGYRTRETIFAAFEAALGGEGPAAALHLARTLPPPPELAAAHSAWLASLRDTLAFEQPARDAIRRDDLGALAVAVARYGSDFLTFATDLPAAMCRAVAPERLAITTICSPEGALPGGEYGHGLRRATAAMPLAVAPRIAGVQPGFTPEETLYYLGAVQPDVERSLDDAIGRIGALDPPDALRADHEAVLRYFGDLRAIAEEITAAAGARDLARIASLVARSPLPAQRLDAALTDPGRRIVGGVLLAG